MAIYYVEIVNSFFGFSGSPVFLVVRCNLLALRKTDDQTDMVKLIVVFQRYENVLKKEMSEVFEIVMVSECMYVCPQFQPLNQLTSVMKRDRNVSLWGNTRSLSNAK
jgi:hypothetical protein